MKSRWLRVLALLLGLSMFAAACGDDDAGTEGAQEVDDAEGTDGETSDPDGEVAEGGTVVFASDQEPDGWNINTASSNLLALGQLTTLVYPSSFRTMPDFEVVMDENLLVSAEQTSDEPQTIEYVIQEDAVWSDGTPITADDFEFQWMMMNGSNPDVDTASTTGYDRIDSVEGSEDGKTVTVTFAEPYSEWRSLFSSMLPAHIIPTLGTGGDAAEGEAAEGEEGEEVTDDAAEGSTDTAEGPSAAAVDGWNNGLDGESLPEFSGGPFMFEDYRPEQSVTLVPNPEWWGEGPNLDELVIRFDVDNAGIPAALENGEIDMAYPQPQLDLVDQVDGLSDIESQISFGLAFEHIDFNLSNPHLAKPEVRKAIAHAADEEDVVARTVGQFSDQAEVLQNRIWLTNQPQYEPHGDEYMGANVDEARSLLEEAGYDCAEAVCTHPEDGPLSLRISTTGGNQLRENTQLVLQNQLAQAGIELTIDNVEGAAVFEKFFPESNLIADQDYDIALFAWVGTPFPSSSKALYTNENAEQVGSNNTGYQNPEVVALFDQALVETDEAAAADLYNQIDEILWEDMPTLPLYQKPTYLPFRSTIQNVQDNASTAGPLWNAYEWSIQG